MQRKYCGCTIIFTNIITFCRLQPQKCPSSCYNVFRVDCEQGNDFRFRHADLFPATRGRGAYNNPSIYYLTHSNTQRCFGSSSYRLKAEKTPWTIHSHTQGLFTLHSLLSIFGSLIPIFCIEIRFLCSCWHYQLNHTYVCMNFETVVQCEPTKL